MKRLTQIFQALIGVVALILTALVAAGRLAWCTICNWWKKRSKWFRRVIATSFLLISVGFVAIIGYAIYDDCYGRAFFNDSGLSKNIRIHFFKDETFRVYNRNLRKYTTPKIDWISKNINHDSLVVYANFNKRGFINAKNGEIVIKAENNSYNKAWVFSEGFAAVMKDGKIGFINVKNEVIIPFQYDCYERTKPWSGYMFHNGYCIMANKDGKMGLIDKMGKWVVEPTYDEIYKSEEKGYRVVAKGGKYGVLDSLNNEIYPVEYNLVSINPSGIILAKCGKKWQVDFDGNIVHPFMFDVTDNLACPNGYNESGDLQYAFTDYMGYKVMNQYGIMNRITGKPITLALYSDINMLSKNMFEVQDPISHDWYVIDTNGNVIK